MVTIYSTPACTYCVKAKDFFKENLISYTEHNVAEKPERRAQMIEMSGGMRVPVMVVNGEILVGFTENQARLKELLNIA